MAGENNSANMSMPIPGVGITTGPTYATDLNNSLTIIDGHDHSAGKGVQITPSGMNISSDLNFLNNNAIALRSMRMTAQSALFSLAPDIGCLYVNGVDLYYRDISGNNVRITSSGAVAGTPGSISNLVAPASATYVPGTQTFVWQSDALTPANMDGASYVLRNLAASSFGLTLNPPAAMGSDSSITLPTLPAATAFMTMDASGNMGTSLPVSGSLTTSNLSASAGILGSQLSASANILGSQLDASANIVGSQLATDLALTGVLTTLNSQRLVVASTNPGANANLAIVRIVSDINANVVSGEGATVVRNSTGIYTVTFTKAFFDTPSVVVTPSSGGIAPAIQSVAPSSVVIATVFTGGGLLNSGFHLIAIGQNV